MQIRKMLLLVSLLVSTQGLQAQTFNEWFKQKKTQKKYLLEQIALLQVYIGYVKKGYKIVEAGLNTVHSIKNGEFNLHDLFYSSLKAVNPRIRQSPQAMAILSHQQYILKAEALLKKKVTNTPVLPAEKKAYLNECVDRLLADVESTGRALLSVATAGDLEMTDDQRIQRIETLYQESLSQASFVQQFSSDIITLIQSLEQEGHEQHLLQKLF